MITLSSKTTITIKPKEPSSSDIPAEELSASGKDFASSFANLLNGFKLGKDDKKPGDNSALVLDLKGDKEELSLKDIKSKESLLSLLKGEDVTEDLEDDIKLNENLTSALSLKDLKQLIKDAKQFLQNQFPKNDNTAKLDLKDLPQTLKGLAKMAEKFGIDISKITMESVKELSKNVDDSVSTDEVLDIKQKFSVKKHINLTDSHNDITSTKETIKNQENLSKIFSKDIQNMPLFKAQSKKVATTQDMVNINRSNVQNIETITPKKRADETLKMLLKGEKVAKKDMTGLTQDFSVATARVISSAKVDNTKNLEYLLSGADKDDTTSSNITTKIDTQTPLKADSFEVKLNEAKQMTKYLSNDVKTAIDNYKAPFTRVKVQLNPQNLGEVDLTIVQRGKNLHINLSSNNTAINALAMNANDLKVQLQNNGINNASLNFNNNPQSQDGSAANQQHNHQGRHQEASKEYNYFDVNEENEEILSSLEIVVPYYA